MEKKEALEIISMIADGLDPYGEKDPIKGLPEINPVTMRAVCVAIVSLMSGTDMDDTKFKHETKKLNKLIESASGPLELYLMEKEKGIIFEALFDAEYDISAAAEILGITYEELIQRIDIHQMGGEILLRVLWVSIETDFSAFFVDKHWGKTISLDQYLEILEKNSIKKALEEANFNKTIAADTLGLSFRSFRYRINKFRIDTNAYQCEIDDRVKTDYFQHAPSKPFDEFIETVEKKVIELALKRTNNIQNRVTDLLGVSFRSLRYRIDKHSIRT